MKPDQLKIHHVADNMPPLLEKLIPGMPIRLSGDEIALIKAAYEIAAKEAERRLGLGRKKIDDPKPKTISQRKWREKNKAR